MVSEDYGKPSPAYLRAGMAAAFSDRQAVGVQAVNADPVIEKGVAWAVACTLWPACGMTTEAAHCVIYKCEPWDLTFPHPRLHTLPCRPGAALAWAPSPALLPLRAVGIQEAAM
ncbi:hypothetical protein ABBQ38_011845 [Trebouxia sp. C0009 RCD-2024]